MLHACALQKMKKVNSKWFEQMLSANSLYDDMFTFGDYKDEIAAEIKKVEEKNPPKDRIIILNTKYETINFTNRPVRTCFCTHCHSKFKELTNSYFFDCPACMKKLSPYRHNENCYKFALEIEGAVVVVAYKYDFEWTASEEAEPRVRRTLHYVSVFSDKFAPFAMIGGYTDKKKTSNSDTFYSNFYPYDLLEKEYPDLAEKTKQFIKINDERKADRAKIRKAKQDVFRNYQLDVDFASKFFKEHYIFLAHKDLDSDMIYCTKCGQFHTIPRQNYQKTSSRVYFSTREELHTLTCPCGSNFDSTHILINTAARVKMKKIFFTNAEDFVVRSDVYFLVDFAKQHVQYIEGYRKFYNGKTHAEFDLMENENMGRVVSVQYPSERKLAQTIEEVANVFKENKHYKYSGISDFLMRTYQIGRALKLSLERFEDAGVDYYLDAWKNTPQIETLMKMNLPSVFDDTLSSNLDARKGKLSFYLSDLTNQERKIVRELNLSYQKAVILHRLYENAPFDLQFAREMYEVAGLDYEMNGRNSFEKLGCLVEINNTYGIKYKDAVAYLMRVRNYQCIRIDDALDLWKDYLNMGRRLGYNFSDKNRKYPNSLKKEHDVSVWAYEAIKQEIKQQLIEENACLNEKKYAYENEDFIVKIPHTTEEIVYEATYQHNCLRSYIERIAEGKTTVAFVRKKEDEATPYATIEINNDGYMTQCYGRSNTRIQDSSFNAFIKAWKKAKKIA